jgi:hypothetical protein
VIVDFGEAFDRERAARARCFTSLLGKARWWSEMLFLREPGRGELRASWRRPLPAVEQVLADDDRVILHQAVRATVDLDEIWDYWSRRCAPLVLTGRYFVRDLVDECPL